VNPGEAERQAWIEKTAKEATLTANLGGVDYQCAVSLAEVDIKV
jgi:hypothetical protein